MNHHTQLIISNFLKIKELENYIRNYKLLIFYFIPYVT